jgi:hypothetical protein
MMAQPGSVVWRSANGARESVYGRASGPKHAGGDDLSRRVDTPRQILRLRDVLAMPFTALRWPWRLWSKLTARRRGPEAVPRLRVQDQRPRITDAREVAALEHAGRVPSAQPVPAELVESAQLAPAGPGLREDPAVRHGSHADQGEVRVTPGILRSDHDVVGVTALATQPLSVGATLDETRQIGANFLADIFGAVSAGVLLARLALTVHGRVLSNR